MKTIPLIIALAAFAFAGTDSAATKTPAKVSQPVIVCGAADASDYVIIPSTVVKYRDMINGVEVWKARAEAITPTECSVKGDTVKTGNP